MKIILGSKSPRRKEIMEMAGYQFDVVVSNADENVSANSIEDMSLAIAQKKCDAISKLYPNDLIITADTIVVIDGKVLEKPKDKEDARRMIHLIQGRMHFVYTSVCVKYKDKEKNFIEKTKVYVGEMTDQEIKEYINIQEPYDKAGAYAIQGVFGKYISKIDGDYYNVMGLPIYKLNKVIKDMVNKKGK